MFAAMVLHKRNSGGNNNNNNNHNNNPASNVANNNHINNNLTNFGRQRLGTTDKPVSHHKIELNFIVHTPPLV